MAGPEAVQPVKRLIAVLFACEEALDEALAHVAGYWGALDFRGSDHAFDSTAYYAPEMGLDLKRRLIAFEHLMSPEDLPRDKLTCNHIEQRLSADLGRRVNLDVGYLDHNKLVLASLKPAGQKIYLGNGVYADLIARYRNGRYQSFEWTFPDFADGRYDRELSRIREHYISQLRARRRAAHS